MNRNLLRRCLFSTTPLLLVFGGALAATDPPGVRAPLRPAGERQAAGNFALEDSSGKTIALADYREKVVLLDFCASWCEPCKKQMPWFAALHETYSSKGLAVIAISLDADWTVLKAFLSDHPMPYPAVLGDDATAESYAVK